jgi:hypothetical protein
VCLSKLPSSLRLILQVPLMVLSEGVSLDVVVDSVKLVL